MKTGNSPSYLVKNSYSYCFRIKIPKDLQMIVAKKELRYSLGTGILSHAKIKARYLAGHFQLLFKNIRMGYLRQMKLSNDQINNIIKDYKVKLFEHYDKPVPYGQYDRKLDRETVAATEYQWLEYTRRDLDAMRIAGDYSEIDKTAGEILNKMGIALADIDKSSDEYSNLCSGLIRAELLGLDRYEGRLNGQFSDELDDILNDGRGQTKKPEPHIPAQKTSLKISQVMEKYFEEGDADKQWTKLDSRNRAKRSMEMLIEYFGDIPIDTVDQECLPE